MFFSVMNLRPQEQNLNFLFIPSWFSIANYALGSDQ